MNVSNTTVDSQSNSFCHSAHSLGAGKLKHFCPVSLAALGQHFNLPLSGKRKRKMLSHKSLNYTLTWSLEALIAG